MPLSRSRTVRLVTLAAATATINLMVPANALAGLPPGWRSDVPTSPVQSATCFPPISFPGIPADGQACLYVTSMPFDVQGQGVVFKDRISRKHDAIVYFSGTTYNAPAW